jgi:hypothetical protein
MLCVVLLYLVGSTCVGQMASYLSWAVGLVIGSDRIRGRVRVSVDKLRVNKNPNNPNFIPANSICCSGSPSSSPIPSATLVTWETLTQPVAHPRSKCNSTTDSSKPKTCRHSTASRCSYEESCVPVSGDTSRSHICSHCTAIAKGYGSPHACARFSLDMLGYNELLLRVLAFCTTLNLFMLFLLVPAVPQAQKASLARFLEGRKERYKLLHTHLLSNGCWQQILCAIETCHL